MKTTVFYDGQCGLCAKEINYYKKIAPPGLFEWQDITQTTEGLEQVGINYIEALRYLHVIDELGYIYRGVESFLVIWKQLPRWRILAAFVGLPLIRPAVNVLYEQFAQWRFKRLNHCQLAKKEY